MAIVVDSERPTHIMRRSEVPTAARDPGGFGTAITGLVREVCDGLGVGSVGIGLPGLVDRDGVLRFGPHLPGLVDVPVGAVVAERLGLAVSVGNDAECATLAEFLCGAGRGVGELLLVTLGTGIGGGLVMRGSPYIGAGGFAAEVGHMVVDSSGPRCACGRSGCWEVFASGSALDRRARGAALEGGLRAAVRLAGGDPSAVTGRHLADAALAGDAEARELIDEFSESVALGLGNLVNVLDPGLVVIGGGLSRLGSLLVDPVRRRLARHSIGGERRTPEVVPAALGPDAGAIGAALLATRHERRVASGRRVSEDPDAEG